MLVRRDEMRESVHGLLGVLPSARIVMVSLFLAPNVMIFNELLALASLLAL